MSQNLENHNMNSCSMKLFIVRFSSEKYSTNHLEVSDELLNTFHCSTALWIHWQGFTSKYILLVEPYLQADILNLIAKYQYLVFCKTLWSCLTCNKDLKQSIHPEKYCSLNWDGTLLLFVDQMFQCLEHVRSSDML